jgi:hypothetical protein
MMAVTVRRFALASPRTAWALAGLVALLAAAVIPLSILSRQDPLAVAGPQLAVTVPFAVVGLVLAWHRPGNPIGWLMIGLAAGLLLYVDCGLYDVINYRLGHPLPLGPAALLLYHASAPLLGLLPLVILLFPDGRLPSPRWRWVLWGYLAVGFAAMALLTVIAAYAIIQHRLQVDAGGQLLLTHAYGAFAALVAVVFGALWLLAVGYQMVSWRRSAGDRRQQLKWLMAGGAAAFIAFATSAALGAAHGLWRVLGLVVLAGVAALPVGMGVAILKYRLYDIDRIISRTLAYAIVSGLLVGVYAALVLLATQVLSFSSPVAVAASTLAAAALFNPLRRRVQKVVDRRFNRARYDADQIVAAFAAHLKDAVDLDSVRDDLAAAVHRALEPAYILVWISQPD